VAAGREAFDTVLYAILPLVLGVVGTLIASRQPGNPIGWLFRGMALWGAVAELGEAYGDVATERGFPGRRWRAAIWVSLGGAALLLAGQALDVEAARAAGIALLLGGLVAAVASSVLRYRGARGVQRQQLK
jgi:hypothetical protein